jgi:hypothetical protein
MQLPGSLAGRSPGPKLLVVAASREMLGVPWRDAVPIPLHPTARLPGQAMPDGTAGVDLAAYPAIRLQGNVKFTFCRRRRP